MTFTQQEKLRASQRSPAFILRLHLMHDRSSSSLFSFVARGKSWQSPTMALNKTTLGFQARNANGLNLLSFSFLKTYSCHSTYEILGVGCCTVTPGQRNPTFHEVRALTIPSAGLHGFPCQAAASHDACRNVIAFLFPTRQSFVEVSEQVRKG